MLAVLINDEPALGELLAEMLRAWTRHTVIVERIGYAARLPGVMKRWLDEGDVFVLGLERHYGEGRCAEGVDVAEYLLKLGRKVLVVGSECNASRVDVTFYWDLGSKESFLEAFGNVLTSPVPAPRERARFAQFFDKRRTKPVSHGAKD
jgi:hypothetical protein